MPWLRLALREQRESPTLLVLTTVLQLGLVVLVWLLVLLPAALVALTMLIVTAVRRALGLSAEIAPYEDGH